MGFTRALVVTIDNLRDLSNEDFIGKTDAFVRIHLDSNGAYPHEAQTDVVEDSLNPDFDKRFIFLFNTEIAIFGIHIYDHDVCANECIGKVEFSLPDPWLIQQISHDFGKGTLNFSYYVVDIPEVMPIYDRMMKAEGETRSLTQTVSDLNSELETVKAQDTSLASVITEQKEQLALQIAEGVEDDELQAKLQAQMEYLEGKLEDDHGAAGEAKAQLQEEIEALKIELEETQNTTNSQIEDLTSELEAAQSQTEALTAELEAAQSQTEALTTELQESKEAAEMELEQLKNKLHETFMSIPMEEISGLYYSGNNLDGYPKECEDLETARAIAKKEIHEAGWSTGFLAFCSERKQIWLKSMAELNHPSVAEGTEDPNMTLFYYPKIQDEA